MRWKKKIKEYPKDGDVRIIKRFLLFLKMINNQYRWLEFVKIEQYYHGYDYTRNTGGFWIDKEWC